MIPENAFAKGVPGSMAIRTAVRKSAGNALRDISKQYPELASAELSTWSLTSGEIKQVHRLAGKFINNRL